MVRIHTDNVTFHKEHDDVIEKHTTKAGMILARGDCDALALLVKFLLITVNGGWKPSSITRGKNLDEAKVEGN